METGYIYQSARPEDHYTKIANQLIRDRGMTAGEKSVLFWFLSHSESKFRILKGDLHIHFKEGREAVSNAFAKLKEKGIINTVQVLDSKGNFAGLNYIINEKAYLEQMNPLTGLPLTDKPLTENPSTNNKKNNSKNLIVETDKKPVSTKGKTLLEILVPDEQVLIEGNYKALGKAKKTVGGKKITLAELEYVKECWLFFHTARKATTGKKTELQFCEKTVRQLVIARREREDFSELTFGIIVENIFKWDVLKDNKCLNRPEYFCRSQTIDTHIEDAA